MACLSCSDLSPLVFPQNDGFSSSPAGDMYAAVDGEDEPEWVATERQQFAEFRDKNNDGKMDKEETLDWILPSDYDHAEAEAKHLLYESDTNKVQADLLHVSIFSFGAFFNASCLGCCCFFSGWTTDQGGDPRQVRPICRQSGDRLRGGIATT